MHHASERRPSPLPPAPRPVLLLCAAIAGACALGCGTRAAPQFAVSAPVPRAAPLYLVVYGPGPSFLTGKPLGEQPLREHGRYLLSLYRQGVLKWAGPFADDSGGALVLEAEDDAAALALVRADPAVETQIFDFQLRRWSPVDWAALDAARK